MKSFLNHANTNAWLLSSLTRAIAIASVAGIAQSGCGSTPEGTEFGETREPLFLEGTVWPTAVVPVCWSATSKMHPQFSTLSVQVRDIARGSWPAYANVEFTGWTDCPTNTANMVVVNLNSNTAANADLGYSPGNTRTVNLGTLRSDFAGGLIPHEFGHILGFGHEMRRADFADDSAPSQCMEGNGTGDFLGTPADRQSIMASTGYCQTNATLSQWDAMGVVKAYGPIKGINGVARATSRLDVVAHNSSDALQTYQWNGSSWSTAQQDGAGTISGVPSIVATNSNRLDAFVRGTDGAVWTKTWNGSSWSGYTQLGTGQIIGNPVGLKTTTDRIYLFVVGTDNALYVKSWDGSTWSGYFSLGGSIVGTPAAIARASNSVDVFARGTDSTLYTTHWNGTSWSSMTQLGTNTIVGNPSVVSWDSSRLDVFVRGTDNALYINSNTGSWSGYQQLGSSPFYGDPTAVSWGSGRIDVFVRGTDGGLYTKHYDGSWSGYARIGSTAVIVGSPTPVSWGSGRIDVFVRGTDQHLYGVSWDSGVGSWSGYTNLGGTLL